MARASLSADPTRLRAHVAALAGPRHRHAAPGALRAAEDYLAATGDGQSAWLLRQFAAAARAAVPDLPLVTFRTPLRGWLVMDTRLSDNASFWDQGYPALMLTDTAFLRNPHYHTAGDRLETLDFGFMARVTDAVAAAVRRLAVAL